MIQYKISVFLVLIVNIFCLSNADLFFLSDTQLFNMGVDQFRNGVFRNQLEGCIINNDPHACSSYAQVCYTNGTCNGLPDLIGSGCLDGCWGPPNTYYNYQSSKLPICTGNVTTNGANMLRIGLLKGYCGRSNDTSLSLAVLNSNLFFLSDAQLFQMGVDQFRNGTFRNQLGGCIVNNVPHACSSYAQACYHDGTCSGLPDLIGSGCLEGCWGPPNTYLNYQSSKVPICTSDATINGANMLRIGLIKGYCGATNASLSNSTSATNASSSVNSSSTNSSSSAKHTSNVTSNTSSINNLSTQNNSAVANASSDQSFSAKKVSQSGQKLPLMQLWIGWAVIVGLLVVIIALLICVLFKSSKSGNGRLTEKSIEYDQDSKYTTGIVNNTG